MKAITSSGSVNNFVLAQSRSVLARPAQAPISADPGSLRMLKLLLASTPVQKHCAAFVHRIFEQQALGVPATESIAFQHQAVSILNAGLLERGLFDCLRLASDSKVMIDDRDRVASRVVSYLDGLLRYYEIELPSIAERPTTIEQLLNRKTIPFRAEDLRWDITLVRDYLENVLRKEALSGEAQASVERLSMRLQELEEKVPHVQAHQDLEAPFQHIHELMARLVSVQQEIKALPVFTLKLPDFPFTYSQEEYAADEEKITGLLNALIQAMDKIVDGFNDLNQRNAVVKGELGAFYREWNEDLVAWDREVGIIFNELNHIINKTTLLAAHLETHVALGEMVKAPELKPLRGRSVQISDKTRFKPHVWRDFLEIPNEVSEMTGMFPELSIGTDQEIYEKMIPGKFSKPDNYLDLKIYAFVEQLWRIRHDVATEDTTSFKEDDFVAIEKIKVEYQKLLYAFIYRKDAATLAALQAYRRTILSDDLANPKFQRLFFTAENLGLTPTEAQHLMGTYVKRTKKPSKTSHPYQELFLSMPEIYAALQKQGDITTLLKIQGGFSKKPLIAETNEVVTSQQTMFYRSLEAPGRVDASPWRQALKKAFVISINRRSFLVIPDGPEFTMCIDYVTNNKRKKGLHNILDAITGEEIKIPAMAKGVRILGTTEIEEAEKTEGGLSYYSKLLRRLDLISETNTGLLDICISAYQYRTQKNGWFWQGLMAVMMDIDGPEETLTASQIKMAIAYWIESYSHYLHDDDKMRKHIRRYVTSYSPQRGDDPMRALR